MSRPLTPELIQQLKRELACRLNWETMPEIWRWRWALLLSDHHLEAKFYALVISIFPDYGRGMNPSLEELAVLGGRQPRSVINHTDALDEETNRFLARTPGRGRSKTSSYKLEIPVKTQVELATYFGIDVQPDGPVRVKMVQQNAPFHQNNGATECTLLPKKVHSVAPFNGKRCNVLPQKVQRVAPPLLYTSKEDKGDSVRPCNLMSGNLSLMPRGRRDCGRFSPPRVGD